MLRSRIPLFLLAASFATVSAVANPVADHRGGNTPTAVSGEYSITFNLNIASTLPANSTIVCKAQIAPGASMYSSFNPQAAAVPFESASSVATVNGATATCVVDIPFAWTVDTTRNGAALSYEIDAINATGSLPAVVRTSAQQNIAEPYPASGNTSTVTFTVTF
jgi:hypothetical protein